LTAFFVSLLISGASLSALDTVEMEIFSFFAMSLIVVGFSMTLNPLFYKTSETACRFPETFPETFPEIFLLISLFNGWKTNTLGLASSFQNTARLLDF
jgi:hypothetical protein